MIKRKKIIFDIGHPGQVHQFKHLYWALEKKGWKCLYIAKKKEFSIYLLEKYNLNYKMLSKSKKGFINKVINMPLDTIKYFFILLQFRPGILLNRFSIQSTIASKILGIPVIGFTDTEHAIYMDRISSPLMKAILTSYSYGLDFGKKHYRFNANIELFYLHPDIFKPDKAILEYLGIWENEKYAIIRFVSWEAYHDRGIKGMKSKFKKDLVYQLSKHSRVFITSEKELEPDLEPYRIQIPAEKMHDVLAFAHLYVGEGATMASEAACLGTPSIYINQLDVGYIKEEAEYDLVYNHRNSERVMDEALTIIKDDEAKEKYKVRLDKFLSKQINPTQFVKWFVEKFPYSASEVIEDSDNQYNFK